MTRPGILLVVASVLATLAASDLSAQCEGSAVPGTTYTQHTDCFSPDNALQWTLSIACVNACGEVWWTLPSREGSADGACNQVTWNFCSPQWYRYNYVNGMYAETSAFASYLYAGCQLRDVPVTTAGDCPCAPPCEEPHDPPYDKPGPCSQPVPVETTVLSLVGSLDGDLESIGESIFSKRIEDGDGVSFIMEDWAVVGVNAHGAGEVLHLDTEARSADRPMPASYRGPQRGALWAPEGSRGLGLLIAAPAHRRDRRQIPQPTVALLPTKLPYQGERLTAAVRIDIDEDRSIRTAQVLYGVGGLPDGIDLAEEVRHHLQVTYASEKQHRVIVFAVLDVGSGEMKLRDSQVVLPQCCCNPLCK